MRKLLNNITLSAKKVRFYKWRSLFVILPISAMVVLFVLLASESQNLLQVARASIFSSLRSQNEVLELSKSATFGPFAQDQSSNYSASDLKSLSEISNVEKATILKQLPLENTTSTNIIDGKSINIASLAGLDEEFAKLYTNSGFNYSEGESIPIILNANDFYEILEDWQGKSELVINPENPVQTSPVKTEKLAYDRDSLIGKEIEISFAGLSPIATIKQSATENGIKYTPKTKDEIAKEEADRKTALSKYWNYDKLSKPLTYTFKIVGIIEGADKTKTYIPSGFAEKLLSDVFNKQLAARNSTAIPTKELNTTYRGLVYDGTTIEEDSNSSLLGQIRNQFNDQVKEQFDDINEQIDKQNQQIQNANRNNNNAIRRFSAGGPGMGGVKIAAPIINNINSVGNLSADSIKVSFDGGAIYYKVPGLVFSQNADSQELTGVVTDKSKLVLANLPGNLALLKINDLANREQVIADLNDKGFRYSDSGQYKSIERLESYLNTALDVVRVVVLAVTALFIFINMSKFVADARKEIGILRAMGANRLDIMLMFNFQALFYSLLAVALGVALGAGLILGLAAKAQELASSVITNILGNSIPLSANISAADFQQIAWEQIGIYAGIMLLVTLLAAFLPAWQASRVSPVEAIRNG
jgi:ABC-type antimicrobial peptide transport system permease subunit